MRTLPEIIRSIHGMGDDGLSNAEVAASLRIPEAVVRDANRGRLPGQIWWDKASPATVAWLARHYPATLA